MENIKFADVPFRRGAPRQAVDYILEVTKSSTEGMDVHFLNAYSLALAESDAQYRSCITESAHNFADGKPISLLSRLGHDKLYQVRGPDFFEQMMDLGRSRRVRHYLLGSTNDTLQKLQRSLEDRYPGVLIAGLCSPPFRTLSPAEQLAQDEEIQAATPDIVWVGLGTPKQDFEAARLAKVGFTAIAVGAAFDFSAGTKRQAPKILTAVGLEWAYRLATEPRRLWRRYLIGNAVFLVAVVRRGATR